MISRKIAGWAVGSLMLAGVLMTGAWSAQGQDAKSAGGSKTMTGMISDEMCGGKHPAGMSAKDCTMTCVGKGSKYALVVGDKVYELNGKSGDFEKLAGEKATVTGDLNGKVITVSKIMAAK